MRTNTELNSAFRDPFHFPKLSVRSNLIYCEPSFRGNGTVLNFDFMMTVQLSTFTKNCRILSNKEANIKIF